MQGRNLFRSIALVGCVILAFTILACSDSGQTLGPITPPTPTNPTDDGNQGSPSDGSDGTSANEASDEGSDSDDDGSTSDDDGSTSDDDNGSTSDDDNGSTSDDDDGSTSSNDAGSYSGDPEDVRIIPSSAEFCTTIDFEEFSHGERVTSISVPEFGLTLAVDVQSKQLGQDVARAFDVTAGHAEDTDLTAPSAGGICTECENPDLSNILVIEDARGFASHGDASDGGTIAFAGFAATDFTYFIEGFTVVDNNEGESPFEAFVDGESVGTSTPRGEAEVEPVPTLRTLFDTDLRFEIGPADGAPTASGGIDNVVLCRCGGEIGDFVWDDRFPEKGIQGVDEPGLEGIRVILKDAQGNVIAETTTDADGAYSFSGLCAGEYSVEVDESTLPADFGQTPTLVGSDRTIDNNPNPDDVTLGDNFSSDLTIDFGFMDMVCDGRIGDFVWNDTGGTKGIQDPGEPGLEGIRVILKDGDGNVVAETTTDADGFYEFTELCAGDYTVEVDESTLPDDFMQTNTLVGNDRTIDNNPNPFDLTLPDNETVDLTVDFGFMEMVCEGRIGDFIWNDLDGTKGIQEQGEPGLGGVRVELLDENGDVIGETRTDADGFYEFRGLCAGEYTVRVDETTLPAGMMQTPTLVGNDRTIDNNENPSTTVLDTDQSEDLTLDFGYMCFGEIGDFVWHDVDRDGIQDAGEPGIQGVRVDLKNTFGQVVGSTTTDADGLYKFTGLCPGDYVVDIDETTVPNGFDPTTVEAGNDTSVDSNPDPSDVTLTEAEPIDLTIDFGFVQECTGRIGDFVWNDTGGTKGIQDSGEPGLEGIRVVLREGGPSGPVIAETTTDADGFYEFTGLCGGDYTVAVDESTLPADFMQTQELVGNDTAIDNNPNPFTLTLPSDDAEDLTVDFGYMEMCEGEIGDRVWNDRFPEKGIQNPEEEGLSGIRVLLKDANGNLLTETTTDADGNYLFTGLCDGDYIVEVDESTLPFGFQQTPTGVGSDPTIDGNPNPAGVNLPTSAASDLTIDFGYMEMQQCQECQGGVTELTLRFMGPDGSRVTVADDVVFFDQVLDNGELFTIRGKNDGEFDKSEIIFTVNGVVVGGLHVSCSAVIGPGTTDENQEKAPSRDGKVDFEVVEGFSKDGGLLCPIPPPPPCQECDGGVSEATFKWLGSTTAQIAVTAKDEPPSQAKADELFFQGTVSPGGTFTVVGNEIGKKISSDIFLWVDGQLVVDGIHLSCSQPFAPGIVFGGLFEVTEAFSEKGGEICPAPPPNGNADFCGDGVNVGSLTFEYTGTSCTDALGHNTQDADKIECTGFLDGNEPVRVLVTEKPDKMDKVFFDSGTASIEIGDTFQAVAQNAGEDKLKGSTAIRTFSTSGQLLQTVTFHTSCSQPLVQGDLFGAHELVDFTPDK